MSIAVRRLMSFVRFASIVVCAVAASAQKDAPAESRPTEAASRPSAGADSRTSVAAEAKPFKFVVPGSVWTATFAPIPSVKGDGATLWMSTTEIPWDAYDVFVFATDLAEGEADLDGVTRPSKPYIPPDRGLGHAGYPAISVAFRGADFFGVWLSKRTGGSFRLPTEAEFESAARAGATGKWCCGDDAKALDAFAWTSENSGEKPRPLATRKANAWGLFDLHGNVGEWCVAADGRGVVKGGNYLLPADEAAAGARKLHDRAWQKTDPQIPKSKLWLTDGPFVGFRVVCDALPTKVKLVP